MNHPTKWFKTDDYQLCQKLSETEFIIIDFFKFSKTNEYFGTKFNIDISDIPTREITAIIQCYGYETIEEVIAAYPNDSNQIIAECLVENWPAYEGDLVFKGTQRQTDKWIAEFILKENKK